MQEMGQARRDSPSRHDPGIVTIFSARVNVLAISFSSRFLSCPPLFLLEQPFFHGFDFSAFATASFQEPRWRPPHPSRFGLQLWVQAEEECEREGKEGFSPFGQKQNSKPHTIARTLQVKKSDTD